MNWDYDDPFIRAVRVLPEHIDALDHTNNLSTSLGAMKRLGLTPRRSAWAQLSIKI